MSGLPVNETAKLTAKLHPKTYQVFQYGEYLSIEYQKKQPDFGFSILDRRKGYEFVIVERQQGKVVSETFHSKFGDTVKVTYRNNQWIRQEYPTHYIQRAA